MNDNSPDGRADHPDPSWVQHWLDSLDEASASPLNIDRIGLGYSNLTYQVRDAEQRRWVLRRPPPGDLLASAHDVVREARIMHALEKTNVPVPRILDVREDDAGTPWVLMEHLDGLVIDDMSAARSLDETQRAAVGRSMAENLAAVHAVNLDSVGLADLARRSPYALRQMRRWTRQWDASKTRDLPELARLTERLSARIPMQDEVTLVHGDFHIKNVITRGDAVVGVLDWELSTLGDPLADVGTLLAYWPQQGEIGTADRTSPSTLAGFPLRSELVDTYARSSERDVTNVPFWHVLGLWKIAIIGEGVRRRSIDNPMARSLAETPTATDIETLVDHTHIVADEYGL